jgi:cellulose 1,4-beta-cellobiosidase
MASIVYAGLAVTSHDSSTSCTAAFDNVTIPGWTILNVPQAPAGLRVSAGDTQVTLGWIGASNVTSYNVKRTTNNGGPYSTIASIATTNYTDIGLTNGTTYYYVVSALNPAGESSNSAQVTVVPCPSTSLSLTETNLTISWSRASEGFRLQSRTNLFLGQWEDMPLPAPEIIGNQWQITLPLADRVGSVFYRLTR